MEKLTSSTASYRESSLLKNIDPFQILRILRDQDSKDSIAFFHTEAVSVIGFRAKEILQVKGENPFALVQKKISERSVKRLDSLPFFQGGALGYFSYDSVRFLEPTLQKTGFQPRYEAEVVFYESYLVFDHLKKTVSLVSSETKSPGELEVALTEIESMILKKGLPKKASAPSLDTPSLPLSSMKLMLGKEAYLEGIKKLKEHILDGDIFQTVISDRFTTPFQGDPLDLFETLCGLSAAPYQFYFALEGRAYLGASPEMLIKANQGVIETHPIAGTRPRGKTEREDDFLAEDLLADEKEKAEHLMLVDLARNDIGRVASPGTVKVETFMKVKKFGGVMHLVSTVTGNLKPEIHAIEALASCFPAGTLSGAPKIRAMELISEIEKSPRHFYGGAFIAASATGDLDSCIAIRSISVEDGIASVQSGAGIVADSVAENEFNEILAKSTLTRKSLALELGKNGAKS